MLGSKLTLFLCAGRKLLVFCIKDGSWLGRCMVKIDLISEWGLDFSLGMKLIWLCGW